MEETKRKLPIFLDNASSVHVPCGPGRYTRRGRKMEHTYEVPYKGRMVRCKTAEAAARLLRALDDEDRRKEEIPWSAHDFDEFTQRIRTFQRRVLNRLLEFGGAWLTDKKLREDLYISNNRILAGILSGISKVALAMDIEPQRAYLSRTRYERGKPVHLYRIAPAFLRAAKEHDWPEKSDLQFEDDE